MAKQYKVNFNEYDFIDEEGTFCGVLAHKMYGKKDNIIAYINLDDGRKIITAAYQTPDDYLGLKDIEIDSRVEVAFNQTKNGKFRLNEIKITQ